MSEKPRRAVMKIQFSRISLPRPDFPSVLHIVMSRIISDSGLHVRITDDISILGFPDGLQIQLVLIANAVDGHRMRNQVPSIGWIQARYTQH
jgi:hypothetical protein